MKNIVLSSLVVVMCSACSISTHYVQTGAKKHTPTNPNDIKIYADSNALNNYTIIGSVATFTQGDGSKAAIELKKEAAALGANAIIAFKLDKLNSIAQATEASGTAVRVNQAN
jgi:hypothetical protein